MKIKLCGIRRALDIEYVNEFLPDYIGFVFAESRRQVNFHQAKSLYNILNKSIKSVGVFVNAPLDSVLEATEILDVIQLHGDEDNSYIEALRAKTDKEIWRAVRASTLNDIINAQGLNADMLLIDSFSANAYGGTGKTADWDLISNAGISRPYFLAGGLTCENVSDAVKKLSPYGIDISGGIETDGSKDRAKIQKIMKILRGEI